MFDYFEYKIIGGILALLALALLCMTYIEVKKNNHIRDLETKLNIYEESYDNYCLEDALKQ